MSDPHLNSLRFRSRECGVRGEKTAALPTLGSNPSILCHIEDLLPGLLAVQR